MSYEERIVVIGLGYVGLPLAAAFGRVAPTLGFDVSDARVQELRKGYDRNDDITAEELRSPRLTFTSDPADLASGDVFVVAVPTPVDASKRPDLRALQGASRTIGAALKARGPAKPGQAPPLVVYESTVYPGCTQEDCVPIIEQTSGLRAGRDFKVGYSPERINPGDREHRLETITKIVSGEDAETLERVAALYGRVVKAGVHRAPDIRTAEAAKVIENTQRDLNIALMNELAILFHRMGIDTQAVLAAAGTKWNFMPFKPGLVGGHCIPEDPYYLTHKAETVGYHPHVILAGRRVNDGMGAYVAHETVKEMIRAGRNVKGARVLVLGASFKENVRDTRNTRVVDLVRELESYGAHVEVHDPVVGAEGVRKLGLHARADDPLADPRAAYDAVVLAVAHEAFTAAPPGAIARLATAPDGSVGPIMDVKGVVARGSDEGRSPHFWVL
jgi:UDP-N-acetyl-D-galactosamine dehydrogenase